VHTLGSKGRFRDTFDNFWNLGGHLKKLQVPHCFIGLTATLRQDDVEDIMQRMSVNKVQMFRKSCFRLTDKTEKYERVK
jgi:superfamily II DNA helicase RecQ